MGWSELGYAASTRGSSLASALGSPVDRTGADERAAKALGFAAAMGPDVKT